MRIAVAGFQHETNSFSRTPADLAAFQIADSWPPLLTGDAVIDGTRGMNLPIAGAVAMAEALAVEPVPILWCAAEPSGPVTDDAFDAITAMMVERLAAAGRLDGLFLDLHGAMITESHDDGEGALLSRLRAALGPEFPIGVSLDLHANVSAAMITHATAIAVFRTYPHLDMAETGGRCLRALVRAILEGPRAIAWAQAPFLVPLFEQCTDVEPCRGLYAGLQEASAEPEETVDLAMGFSAADIADCGPAVIAQAATPERAEALAAATLARLCDAEAAFQDTLVSAPEAARIAMASTDPRPMVLADVQDNPGGGATSDTTGLARALIDAGATGAIIGLMHDPEIARAAHYAGVGSTLTGALGGRSGLPGEAPLEGRFQVRAVSDGRIAYGGAMYGGGVAELGSSCLLQFTDGAADILFAVSSLRCQCLDRALLTGLGADLAAARIIVVKSTAHFRADFAPVAGRILNVASAGLLPGRLTETPYRNLRDGLRLGPLGPPFRPRR